MLETSYFKRYRGAYGISVALKSPPHFTGRMFPKLAPHWGMIQRLRAPRVVAPGQRTPEEVYTAEYHKIILSRLNPEEVYDKLSKMGKVLLCYEAPGEFCHRRIIAEWFESSIPGVIVPEAIYPD